jgi:heptosyltransferase-2
MVSSKPPSSLPNVTLSPDSGCTIAIRGPNWVGDLVMATPAFRCLRENFPSAHITLVVRSGITGVIRNAPWFDEIIEYERDGSRISTAKHFLQCVSTLKRREYGLGIILPNSFSSALMMKLASVKERIGYIKDARRWLLTQPVQRPTRPDGSFKPSYMANYYLNLLAAIGIGCDNPRTELHFSDEDMSAAQKLLNKAGIHPDDELILFHPNAGYGPSKLWPADYFARLAELLGAEVACKIACIGSPDSSQLVSKIKEIAGYPITDLTRAGIDLHLLKCVIRSSRLLVSTDSGPRHYGVALGIPTLCIMGPTHPDYSTSERPNDGVLRVDVDCGPCQQKHCRTDHRCMRNITPDMAFEKCMEALNQNG